MKAIELATFRLKADTSEEVFMAALADTDAWLAKQAGFILRRHGQNCEGDRVDYVEWESMEAAKAAAVRFETAQETQAFMNSIDIDQTQCIHYDLVTSSAQFVSDTA